MSSKASPQLHPPTKKKKKKKITNQLPTLSLNEAYNHDGEKFPVEEEADSAGERAFSTAQEFETGFVHGLSLARSLNYRLIDAG